MIDRRSAYLLEWINAQSEGGGFKVFEAGELLDSLPKKLGLDAAALAKAMEYLAEEELIVLKYADEQSYCVASTPKGRAYGEKKTEEQREISTQRRFLIANLICSAIGGFVGALVAILVMLPFLG